MQDRTVTLGSAGKTFSLTGWKIGWIVGSAELIRAIWMVRPCPRAQTRAPDASHPVASAPFLALVHTQVHQFNVFSVATPLQVRHRPTRIALRRGRR